VRSVPPPARLSRRFLPHPIYAIASRPPKTAARTQQRGGYTTSRQTEDWEPEGRCMSMRSPRALVGGVGFDVRAGISMGGILVNCEGTGSLSAVWIASGQDEGCTVTANGPLHPLVCILRSTRVQACPPPIVRTSCLGGCVLASTAATSRSHSRLRVCQLHHHLVCFSHLWIDAGWAGVVHHGTSREEVLPPIVNVPHLRCSSHRYHIHGVVGIWQATPMSSSTRCEPH